MNTQLLDEIRRQGSLELIARQLVEGFITGLHKSPYHGFSVEFAEHRLYNEGQSTRHIDWKIYARTDRLFTKQYEEETNLRCLLAIDCSSSMFYPAPQHDKLKFSLYCGSALAYLLHKQRDAVGLCLYSDKIDEWTAIRSTRSHLDKIFGSLQRLQDQGVQGQKRTDIAKVLHEVAEKIHKRSLVVIFSDMFEQTDQADQLFKALQHLKHNRHEVILFHVTDHQTELDLDLQNRPYEFVDLEDGSRVRLNPSEIRNSYQQQLLSFHNYLKLRCGQIKVDFISVDAQTDYFEVLQAYLIKRTKMH
ncbi:MAG: DUF58 domain-containing protein [Cyclobacteriaceae bacterium]|nr:DUF58 domain-containing protein [Cyclobacteriaceae bacterium]